MAGAAADMEARWPRWPDGEEGKMALDVVLDLPIDQAFVLLYGGLTDMRKAFNEAAGDKEYSTTAWMEGAEAVQAAAVGPTPPPLASVAALKPGMLRRASYSGTMMGSKFRNEELHRLTEASPGSTFSVMTTVLTTAMHGEKFRPVVLSTLRALPDGRTEFRIRTTILFVIKPNGFIKAMIDKGGREGQRKNFEALRKVLSQFTTVLEPAEAAAEGVPGAAGPAATVAMAAPGAAAAAGELAVEASVMESVLGAAACRGLDPWAGLLHARLAALSPMLGDVMPPALLLGTLGALSLLAVLRLVIDMLLFVQRASAQPQDSISLLTHYLFRLVDVPESVQEVLVSCLIFYTVRLLVNRLATVLPAAPRAHRAAAGTAGGRSAAAAGPGGSGAGGAALGAGQGTASPKPGRTEEQEAEGVKYEGYAEAIAAAQDLPISPVASSASATPGTAEYAAAAAAAAAAARQQQSVFSMKGLTKSISDAFTPARPKKGSAAAFSTGWAPPLATPAVNAASEAERPAVALGQAPPASTPLAAGAAAVAAAGAAAGAAAAGAAAASAAVGAAAGAAGGGAAAGAAAAGGAGTSRLSPPLPGSHVLRSLSDTEAMHPGVSGSLTPEASGSNFGDGGTLPPGSTSPPLSGQDSFPRTHSALHHAKSVGSLPDQSGASVSALGRKLRGVLSPTGQPSSPRERLSSNEGSSAASPDRGDTFSPTAAQRDFRPGMAAHLAPELAGQAVIEEVFENQRMQPFRGWGHTWPGHFLPTDKVNHWSRREHEGFPLLAGQDFESIAPPLPEGWQWCEEKWHIDRSGQIIDACDEDGWTYGLDFGYVRHPFQPNTGKKKMSDFVRRRRWIRTRVPLELAPQRRSTAIAEDSSSWSEAVAGDVDALAAPGELLVALEPAEAMGGAAGAAGAAAAGAAAAEVAAEAGAELAAQGEPDAVAGESAAPAMSQPSPAVPADVAAAAGLGAAQTADGLPLGGSEADAGLEASPSGDQRHVAAVLESIFAQVQAKSAHASMQEALAQTIGSRSGSGSALLPASPAKERPAVDAGSGRAAHAGGSEAGASGSGAAVAVDRPTPGADATALVQEDEGQGFQPASRSTGTSGASGSASGAGPAPLEAAIDVAAVPGQASGAAAATAAAVPEQQGSVPLPASAAHGAPPPMPAGPQASGAGAGLGAHDSSSSTAASTAGSAPTAGVQAGAEQAPSLVEQEEAAAAPAETTAPAAGAEADAAGHPTSKQQPGEPAQEEAVQPAVQDAAPTAVPEASAWSAGAAASAAGEAQQAGQGDEEGLERADGLGELATHAAVAAAAVPEEEGAHSGDEAEASHEASAEAAAAGQEEMEAAAQAATVAALPEEEGEEEQSVGEAEASHASADALHLVAHR